MVDKFENNSTGLSDIARNHFVITKSDSTNYVTDTSLVRPRALLLNNGSGDIVITGDNGDVTYNITTGTGGLVVLPISPVKVKSTGTTFNGSIIGIY